MSVTVSFCCQDDHGLFTGRATRFDCQEYELEVGDTLWPACGAQLKIADGRIKVGRDIWRPFHGSGGGGNIFWLSFRVAGVDAIGIMNYLMTLKWWRAQAGECYLFDQFNAKQPIIPREFFESRSPSGAAKETK